MQASRREQNEKEIFVVVGNRRPRDSAPTLASGPVHAQAPRVAPFSRTKDKPSATQVRSCRCVALAHRSCGGSAGPGGHRRWGRFGRSASLSDHNWDFTSSECCDLCGNWIDSLDFRGGIFPFLSKALAKLVLPSAGLLQLAALRRRTRRSLRPARHPQRPHTPTTIHLQRDSWTPRRDSSLAKRREAMAERDKLCPQW